ncbi:MAG: 4-oxalocrotonate tautomerase family protein [Deltaproteobacteria bacterium]|nr:4-oxalocrotonate tautomerase family protein [Deltaproteobacteria bacterium]
MALPFHQGGISLPFINIKVLKGTLSKEKKQEMIKRVSETVAEIEASPNPKDNLVPYTWCVIEEVDFENWGIGGNAVTPEMLKAILEG